LSRCFFGDGRAAARLFRQWRIGRRECDAGRPDRNPHHDRRPPRPPRNAVSRAGIHARYHRAEALAPLRLAQTHFTVTVPTILGWIEQTYLYVPGLLKVNVK